MSESSEKLIQRLTEEARAALIKHLREEIPKHADAILALTDDWHSRCDELRGPSYAGIANLIRCLIQELRERKELWEDIKHIGPGSSLTVWTHGHVYFTVGYDGYEWVASVSRNPCDESYWFSG